MRSYFHHALRAHLLFLIGTISGLAIIPNNVNAERTGISATIGSGIFASFEDNYYGDVKIDLYPEIGFNIEVNTVRLGIMTGLIYRKFEGYNYWYHYEYTRAFLPVQAQILVAPLSSDKDSYVSPYIGFMGGAFIPVGNNDNILPALSAKAGAEFFLKPVILYGDIRYTYAWDEEFSANAGGVMLVVGGGIRFGSFN